jgi:ABC-type branched-subunit amino acid transport system substrate-binding protein
MRPVLSVVAGALLLAVLAVLACAPPPEPPWEKDARALLDQAETQFGKKQFEQAQKTVAGFFTAYPKSRHADRAYYLLGEMRLQLRDYQRALSYYKEIIERFPASPLIIEAKYKLGVCYFELKEYDLAVANLEDRSRITDPARLRRVAEMLSTVYLAKKNYLPAVRELASLADTSTNEKQKAGYRDRIREIVDKNLTEDDLRSLASDDAYPADIALLRLAGLELGQRNYRDALDAARDFLDRFPSHPEITRAEMLSAEATAMLSAPRYRLGVLIPQSGPASFFGDRVLKGIQLAVHAYNTQDPENRVELLVRDTEGAPDKAAAGLAELADKGVVAVIGPLLTKEVEALAPSLAKLRMPLFTPTASGPGLTDLSPWIFRNALTNATQARAAAEYALRQHFKRFAIFHPDDAYGRDLVRLFTKDLEKKTEILAVIPYPPEVNDFGPYIRRLIEIDLRSQRIPIPDDDQERKKLFQSYAPSFDALYLPGYADKVGLLIPQLAFYNITGRALIGSNNWHSPDLIERAGHHAEGAVFVDGFYPESNDPEVKSAIDAYRSAYQEEPDILAAQAHDAAAMVLSLLKERRDTPAAVRDGLLAIRDFTGISGTASFPGSGEAQKKLFLIKIEDSRFTLLRE